MANLPDNFSQTSFSQRFVPAALQSANDELESLEAAFDALEELDDLNADQEAEYWELERQIGEARYLRNYMETN
ncbi:hypothetical protein ACQW08_04465 [Gluconobacter japonicus]|uniref:hypothetical protein n=1 Tax=Gluconobacter japonicus TaxID=376620 RepID=UPI003D2DE32D